MIRTKSITALRPIIEHLGLVLNSVEITASISLDKHQKLCRATLHVLELDMPSIRAVAQIIGMMVDGSPFRGVKYGQLFYRQLEIDRITALKLHQGDFDMPMTLYDHLKEEINHGKIGHVIYTDASIKWGGGQQC